MTEKYEPVYLKNESIVDKKYKAGDKITFEVLEVMDDGVKAVCSHGKNKGGDADGRKEMAENVNRRYREAMDEGMNGGGAY